MKGESWTGADDNKLNSQYQKLLNNEKRTMDSAGEDVKDIPHKYPGSTPTTGKCIMHTNIMNFTKLLESMDAVISYLQEEATDPMNDSIGDVGSMNTDADSGVPAEQPSMPSTGDGDNTDLLDQLNKIFTPILVMQGFENEVSDKIQESISEATVLTEQNIIKFDDQTRMAQLIATCALLIARKRNTPNYQLYHKAHIARNQAKINIQKDHYDEAKALAQQFLVKVSTTNNSSVARDAANNLLPETQH